MNFEQEFQSPFWLYNGHLQTIWPAVVGRLILQKKVEPTYIRKRWVTPDDDFIEIDSDMSFFNGKGPVVVLFHGLEGSSSSYYAQAFYQACKEQNFSLSIPHFRGCSGIDNKQARSYHAGDSEEVNWIIHKYSKICTSQQRDLYILGISLGGNALLHWAGNYISDSKIFPNLRSIISISAPINLRESSIKIDRGFNRLIYANHFLRPMKKKAKKKCIQFPNELSISDIQRARTISDFDDAYTAPVHGFSDVKDYWNRASSSRVIDKIKIKTLLIHSKNDPIVPFLSLPHRIISRNPFIESWFPESGGHASFLHSSDPTSFWVNHVFFPKVVLNWCKNLT